MISLLLALAAQAVAATPPINPAETRLRECAALARTAPDQALSQANEWRIRGGGIHARQCIGLSYAALERWAPAATVYEQAAREAEAALDGRATDLWVQSGNAWLAADEPTKAILAFDTALAAPSLTAELRGEVHLDRARALVAMNNHAGARTEIDRGLELVPADPFAWYLSAALARREQNIQRAQTDIAKARELAPDDADIMLLAGTIAALTGDTAEAGRLYQRVVAAAPQSEAGQAAQAALTAPPPSAEESAPEPDDD